MTRLMEKMNSTVSVSWKWLAATLAGAIIAGTVAWAGFMMGKDVEIRSSLNSLQSQQTQLEVRQVRTETELALLRTSLTRMDDKLDEILRQHVQLGKDLKGR